MNYFYSPETGGFYIAGVHPYIPGDVIEVTKDEYAVLLSQVSNGKRIVYKGRKLQLVDQELVPRTWAQIRERRDFLLASCDWTQLGDNALSDDMKITWADYRQKLRDITKKYKDPNKVVWPLDPNTIKE
jgi:hypothetical protein